jgi:homogentisate 1,2-dioxygenase
MPVTNFAHPDPYVYQTGFDSYHEYVSYRSKR